MNDESGHQGPLGDGTPAALLRLPGYDAAAPALEVAGMTVEFGATRVVDDVGYAVEPGRTLAVLGESGSGKSATARAVMGLVRPPHGHVVAGSARVHGVDLMALPPRQHRALRGSTVAMVFQDPLSALNPVLSVGYQVAELFRAHRGLGRRQARRRALDVLDRVHIPDAARRARDYPHQFSGGMRQRIGIAMAVALEPRVIIADEPTTALDVTVQAQILRLLAEIQREHGTALVLITHDMGVVAETADQVTVMYAGRVVERAPVADAYAHPHHPYTRALLQAVPRHSDGRRPRLLAAIPGAPPDPARPRPGCRFLPRCAHAVEACGQTPPLQRIAPHRDSACHQWKEVTAP